MVATGALALRIQCTARLVRRSARRQSALSEFPHLEAADLEHGRVSGQLTVQRRSCHGNFYWLYQRSQIQAFARTVTPSVAKAAELEAKRLKQLKKTAPKELATVDEQLQALLRKKAELEGLVLQQQQQQQKAKAKRPAAGKRKKRLTTTTTTIRTMAARAGTIGLPTTKTRRVVASSLRASRGAPSENTTATQARTRCFEF